MAKHRRAIEEIQKQKSVQTKPKPVKVDHDFESLADEAAPLRVSNATVVARLGDGRLQETQRRTLAVQIGKTQGNQHLQRVVSALKRDAEPQAANAGTPKTLSGAGWVAQFPTGKSVEDLDSTFGASVQKFIDALQAASAKVTIQATKRPPERAYLMHWAWKIAKKDYDARKVPGRAGININWWHGNQADSKRAAQEMVDAYKINNLQVAPSLSSRHIKGKAIDMSISWSGDLKIKDVGGTERIITSSPKNHTNSDLIAVGSTYDVIHFVNVNKDKVHWSTDGR